MNNDEAAARAAGASHADALEHTPGPLAAWVETARRALNGDHTADPPGLKVPHGADRTALRRAYFAGLLARAAALQDNKAAKEPSRRLPTANRQFAEAMRLYAAARGVSMVRAYKDLAPVLDAS